MKKNTLNEDRVKQRIAQEKYDKELAELEKVKNFIEIDTTEKDDDLVSQGLTDAKIGDKFVLQVVVREKNKIAFGLAKLEI